MSDHRHFPRSKRVYLQGSRPDLRVPLREIELTTRPGQPADPSVRVYDTSGAHGDAEAKVELVHGLPKLRDAWIRERGDVEEYDGRPAQPSDDGGRTRARRRPSPAGARDRCARSPDATSRRCTTRGAAS